MPTIVITPEEAKLIADGCLAATSKDDVTPLICAAHITADEDGKVTAAATDRYRVHRIFAKSTAQHKEPFDVVLDNATLKWLSVNARRYVKGWPDPIVVIDADERDGTKHVTITIQESASGAGRSLSLEEYGVAGVYPPIARLFDEIDPESKVAESVGLRPEYLGALGALIRRKGQPVKMFTPRSARLGSTTKAAPVRFEFQDDAGNVYADALIQPHLGLR